MDYKHYRGDPLRIPEWLEPYLHLLKYIGVILALTPTVVAWLWILKIIPQYLWWSLLAVISYPLGLTFFIIGLFFSTTADRSK